MKTTIEITTDMMAKLPGSFSQVSTLRKEDRYHADMDPVSLIDFHFPPTVADLTLSLSNNTAMFYGVLLKQVGNLLGTQYIQKVSDAALYELGSIRARNAIAKCPDLERNARGLSDLLVSAIFTSSPEYRFTVEEYSVDRAKIIMSGIDRYHRAAMITGIVEYLAWPVIIPTIQAMIDEMGLQYNIGFHMQTLDSNSSCLYEIVLTK